MFHVKVTEVELLIVTVRLRGILGAKDKNITLYKCILYLSNTISKSRGVPIRKILASTDIR